MEIDQYVKVCVPMIGPGGTGHVMSGLIKEIRHERCIVLCRDGKERFFSARVLLPMSPLEILAEMAED